MAGIRPTDGPAEDVVFMVTQNKLHSPECNIAPRDDSEGERDQTHSGKNNAVTGRNRNLPLITLPPRLPKQQRRRTQSNIPNDRARRDRLRQVAAEVVAQENAVPPLTIDELGALTVIVRERVGIDGTYDDFLAVIISNEAWRESVARVPFDRRLLLVPKCLRVAECCPAPVDAVVLLCQEG